MEKFELNIQYVDGSFGTITVVKERGKTNYREVKEIVNNLIREQLENGYTEINLTEINDELINSYGFYYEDITVINVNF